MTDTNNTDGAVEQGQRYIVLWRKPATVLDWDFYVAERLEDARRVVANVTAQGANQYRTYVLGDKLPDLSSEF